MKIVYAMLALLALLTGCARDQETHPLTVSVASSLAEPVGELARTFQIEQPGASVRINSAASGALLQQIEHGAEVDVFVSASERQMEMLDLRRRIDPNSRRVIAANDLVFVVPRGPGSRPGTLQGLASGSVRRIAIGAPSSVPVGEYAREALERSGLWERVRGKLVLAQSARQALTYVERGDVDAGLVYRSDAERSERVRIVAPVPATLHRPIVYPAAVLQESRSSERARAFVEYLTSPAGRTVLRQHGLRVEK